MKQSKQSQLSILARLNKQLNRTSKQLVVVFSSELARRLILGLFVVQAVILVFVVRLGVPPDEYNHIAFIDYYANHSLSPIFNDQQPNYYLGDKTREVDYLYHYFMSLVVRILPFSSSVDYHIVRLFTVALALLSFVLLIKIFKRLRLSDGSINLSLLVLTNLSMVLMMSMAVNNDVTVWLGFILGLFLLLRLWQDPRLVDLLWLAVVAVSGGLFKRTLLPLGLVFAIVGLIIAVKNFRLFARQLQKPSWQFWLASLLLVVSIGLFAERIGGNLLRYGSLTVTCEQVHGTDACYSFWANERSREMGPTPTNKLISAPLFAYRWINTSIDNITDIQTQKWKHTEVPPGWLAPGLGVLALIGLIAGVISDGKLFSQNAVPRYRIYVLAIGCFFLVTHLVVNWGEYQHYRVYGIALNGRYIIPILLPFAGLACFYWSTLLKRLLGLKLVLATVIVILVVCFSGLSLILRNSQIRQPVPGGPLTNSYQSHT